MDKILVLFGMIVFVFIIEKAIFFHTSIMLPRIFGINDGNEIEEMFPNQFSISNRIYFVIAYVGSCVFSIFTEWKYTILSFLLLYITFFSLILYDFCVFFRNYRRNYK